MRYRVSKKELTNPIPIETIKKNGRDFEARIKRTGVLIKSLRRLGVRYAVTYCKFQRQIFTSETDLHQD